MFGKGSMLESHDVDLHSRNEEQIGCSKNPINDIADQNNSSQPQPIPNLSCENQEKSLPRRLSKDQDIFSSLMAKV